MTSPARVIRLCDLCGGVDSHPRHVHSVPADTPGTVPTAEFIRKAITDGASDEAIAELMDPTTFVRHLRCCANEGCDPCIQTLSAAGDRDGDDLLNFILQGA